MTSETIRVRFPPSPTGYLHVGGARTALFNWLLARQRSGVLVLRIEDTDRDRSSEAHTRAILDGMTWLGLDWDEGPFFQSDGVERHRAAALRLLDEGKAYHDFSDPGELREEAARRGVGHPSAIAREWADATGVDAARERAAAGEPHAIRLRIPAGETAWDDAVHGRMSFANRDLDDFVILRSDGSPIYNLAVVCDDAEQRITHVIRGDDHLSNTPKQILLYEALGWPVPTFGHVPMILGADGKRLSKRHGATAVADYEAHGILPDAMVNFLALLGWNPGDEREVMDRAELIEAFSMDRVQKKSAVFDTDKLEWLNGRYVAGLPLAALVPSALDRLEARGLGPDRWDPEAPGPEDEGFGALLQLLQSRARTIEDLAEQAEPFLVAEPELEAAATRKHWARDPAATAEGLRALWSALDAGSWEEGPLEVRLRTCAEERGVGAGKVIHPLRVALTGRTRSPGIFEVLAWLGRDRAERRVRRALSILEEPDVFLS
ncbi:MAG: glutamate--tRNA ligase [Gemmatimonadetes bacterium]|nr:glutamate--tRNA ligase [Gemmatimonadota bacterium]